MKKLQGVLIKDHEKITTNDITHTKQKTTIQTSCQVYLYVVAVVIVIVRAYHKVSICCLSLNSRNVC